MKDIMPNNLLIFIRFRIQWPILIKNSSTEILLYSPVLSTYVFLELDTFTFMVFNL